jgi:hypothetical protein
MLSATVTKKSVVYAQPKLHIITFNLVLKEDTVEVLNKDFSVNFFPGDSPAEKTAKVIEEMNIEIAKYKAEKVIFDSSLLNTAVTTIQNGLSL